MQTGDSIISRDIEALRRAIEEVGSRVAVHERGGGEPPVSNRKAKRNSRLDKMAMNFQKYKRRK